MADDLRLSGAQPSWRSECDIRYNYANLNQIIAAANTSGNQAQLYSSDGGATWSQTILPSAPGDVRQGDPAVDWTSDGTAWALTVGISASNAVRCFKSTNAGQSWAFDSTVSGSQTNVDKPVLWVDHSPSSPHRDNMYALWWNHGPTYISRRVGAAGAWGAPQQISAGETTVGSDGGDVKTNAFGDVYVFWPSENERTLNFAKSTATRSPFSSTASRRPRTAAACFSTSREELGALVQTISLMLCGWIWRAVLVVTRPRTSLEATLIPPARRVSGSPALPTAGRIGPHR